MTKQSPNNFDFLRAVAAGLVIVGHQFVLAGQPDLVPTIFGRGVHVLGVEIFFSVSGYLVWISWQNDPHLGRFFSKRALRIFPGLAGVCIFAVFILGVAATKSPLTEYLTDSRTYFYFANIALYINFFLPGVFEGARASAAVNGSLWSLPAEAFLYMLTAVIGILLASKKLCSSVALGVVLILGTASKIYFSMHPPVAPLIVWGTSLLATLDAGVYFLGGAFIATMNRILKPRLSIAGIALGALVILPLELIACVDAFLLPYIVLAIGCASTFGIRQAAKYGDFSYGISLYAFPVQQFFLIKFLPHLSVFWIFVPVFAVTTLLAALSWHLLEKPLLRFKPGASAKKALLLTPQS